MDRLQHGEGPTFAQQLETQLYVDELPTFMQVAGGVPAANWSQRPAMLPQRNVHVDVDHADDFEARLREITVAGAPLKYRRADHGFFSMEWGQANLHDRSDARSTTCTCAQATTRTGTRTPASPARTRRSSRSPASSAVKGATEMLRDEIFKLAGAVFGGVPAEALELADGGIRIKDNPEAFLPFMACGAIINANNAGLPEDLGVTLNCRYVYRPPFEVPDIETQVRQPDAHVRRADPRRRDRDRSRDRPLRHRRLRRRRRLRQAHQPADRRGPGDGRDGAGARRGDRTSSFVYDEDGNLLTPELLRLPRAARAGHAAAADRLRREPVAVHAARHERNGRRRRRRHPCGVLRRAGRPARPRRRSGLRQLQSVRHRVREMLERSVERRANRRCPARERLGRAHVRSAARRGVAGAERSGVNSEDAGVESFDVHDEKRWTANVKIPLGLGGLRMKVDMEKVDERAPEHAEAERSRARVSARCSRMQTSFDLSDADGTGPLMKWAADVKIAGPVGSMGQRVLQPIVNQQVAHVLSALDREVQNAVASVAGWRCRSASG